MPELTLTEPAAELFSMVVDMFNAATAPGAASSFSLTLGDSGGGFGFSLGGGSAAAATADGGGAAAPSGGEGGGAAPAPSAD